MSGRRMDESGFSILGVLVAIGISSIMFSALADMAVLSVKTQKNIIIRTEFDDYVESVRRVMHLATTCNSAIVGLNYADPLTIKDPFDLNKTLAQANQTKGNGWTLTKALFEDVRPVPDQEALMHASLYLEARKDTRISLGPSILKRKIVDVYFEVRKNGPHLTQVVTRCFGSYLPELKAQADCLLLGGKWLGDKESGAKCVIIAQQEASTPGK